MTEKNHFKQFVASMNEAMENNELLDGRDQQDLMESLFKLEDKFKEILSSTSYGQGMYQKFIDFIVNDKGNILSSRVYFRERQETFSREISSIFRTGKYLQLQKYKINFMFAKWICDRYKEGPKEKKLKGVLDEITKIRKTICEDNLPLAINRAKIFWGKIPHSELDYMDIIQDAAEGLITAIDKFVPPYKTVFRSVAIGRMSLNMLTDHNATLIKFSPRDRRILYRANNARIKEKLTNIDDVLKYVQQSFHDVTREKLESILISASDAVRTGGPTDDESDDGDSSFPLENVADLSIDQETVLTVKDFMVKIIPLLREIPTIHSKVIRMKFSINSPNNQKKQTT